MDVCTVGQMLQIEIPTGFRLLKYQNTELERVNFPFVYAYNFATGKWREFSVFDYDSEGSKFLLLVVPGV